MFISAPLWWSRCHGEKPASSYAVCRRHRLGEVKVKPLVVSPLVGEMAGGQRGLNAKLCIRRRRICREHTLQHSEDAVIRLRHVVLMGERESRPPLACRPSPPQGGEYLRRALAPASAFCPWHRFGHAKVKPFIVCPKAMVPREGQMCICPSPVVGGRGAARWPLLSSRDPARSYISWNNTYIK